MQETSEVIETKGEDFQSYRKHRDENGKTSTGLVTKARAHSVELGRGKRLEWKKVKERKK